MARLNYTIAAILLLFSGLAQADGIRPLLSMGLTSGGDNLLTIYSSSGTNKIRAGGFVYFSAGGIFEIGESNLEAMLSLGHFSDSQTYTNGDASFSRIPLDGLIMYKASDLIHFGAGVTYHLNPELSCDITAICSSDTDFDNALGMVLQVDWMLYELKDESVRLGLRYTTIEYSGPFTGTVDGSHAGLVLSATL